MKDENKRQKMAKAAKTISNPQAASTIAKKLLKIL